jgi:hypothetical protein
MISQIGRAFSRGCVSPFFEHLNDQRQDLFLLFIRKRLNLFEDGLSGLLT